jgi:hypothetical protein
MCLSSIVQLTASARPCSGRPAAGRGRGGRRRDGDDDNAKGNAPGPAKTEFSMNIGYQFGLTDVTSDGALKFQGSLAF